MTFTHGANRICRTIYLTSFWLRPSRPDRLKERAWRRVSSGAGFPTVKTLETCRGVRKRNIEILSGRQGIIIEMIYGCPMRSFFLDSSSGAITIY